jgi:ornithine cyclodeaminase
MDLVILDSREIRRLLTPRICLELMERAMQVALSKEAIQPLRWMMDLPGGAALGLMPGYLPEPKCTGVKVTAVFPSNSREFPSHQGAVLLFEAEHGCPLGIFHGGEITAIRTAAASALATRHLARQDAATLALLGCGEQADRHLDAIVGIRDIARVIVWGRSRDRAEAFVGRHASRYPGVTFSVAATVEDAVASADIVCTVTAAADPILMGKWLPDGVHLNVVGSSVAACAEVDEEAVARATLFVDYRPSTVAQGGEYLRALRTGKIASDHIVAEIGEVIAGRHPGRSSSPEITMYKSLGINAQDLASAYYLYCQARSRKLGTWIDF